MDSPQTERFSTLRDVVRSRVSPNIKKIIDATRGYGATVVDIPLFLDAARSAIPDGTGAETVVRTLFGTKAIALPAAEISSATMSSAAMSITTMSLSPGLSHAFVEAHQIRARTGGADDYIGLRHVIFAIFTSTDPEIMGETTPLLSRSRVPRKRAAEVIGQFVDHAMEQQEREKVWSEIFIERNLTPPGSDSAPTPRPLTQRGRVRRKREGPEVALLGSDDPWSAGAVDHSGAQAEADAFAAMIAARQFVPPLAIGIFGEWGSGKSFFMRLVYDAIEQRRPWPLQAPLSSDGGIDLLNNVVQIRFNAWHYAETNLWASLVDHIFTSLDRWAENVNQQGSTDKVFDRLATARRLTIESAEALVQARRAHKAAEERLKEAKTGLAQKTAELASRPSTWVKTAFDRLIGDKRPDERQALQNAADMLGLGPITASFSDLIDAGSTLDDAAASYGIIRSATLRRLSLPLVVIVVTALALVLPPLLAWLSELSSRAIEVQISPVAAAVSGAFAPVVGAVGWVTKKTLDAADKIRTFQGALQIEVDRLEEAEKAAMTEARTSLDEATVEVGQAEERLRIAGEEAAEAANDYNLKSGKGRVLRFVRERVAKGDYARHLSFIATVRKDFEELSVLMSPSEDAALAEKARQASSAHIRKVLEDAGTLLDQSEKDKLMESVKSPDEELRVFERIVLYIDDLDRCPPKQVVEVLQAIHLLLTFPLFVVMVAVDVRWVREALAANYPGQIDERRESSGKGSATAGDYLEKIFQIPYWVRPMTADNTRDLLEDRLGAEIGEEAKPTQTAAQATPAIRPTETTRANTSALGDTEASTPARRLSGLHITRTERAFIMQAAGVLDHSPRRTLRFVNSYRLIKASLPVQAVDHLEAGGYRALLTLLAIATCASGPGAKFIADLRENRVPVLSDSGDVETVRVANAHKLYGTDSTGNADLFEYAALVSRFSFEDR